MEIWILILDFLSFLLKLGYTAVFFLAVSTFIPPRQHWILKILAFLFLTFFAPVIVYLNDPVNISLALAAFVIYLIIFHRGKWLKKVTAMLVFYPIVIAVNFLLHSFSSDLFFALSHAPNPEYDSNGALINWSVETQIFSSTMWGLFQAVRLLLWIGIILFLRRYKDQITSEKIENRTWLLADAIMLISTVSLLTVIYFISSINTIVYPLCVVVIIAGLGGIVLVNYMSRSEETAREMVKLQMQYAYYEEKRKEEERVRAIYHDMKNHLLVLEKQAGQPETAGTAEKLREQIAEYEDFVRTGNDILDIILKEKSHQARKKKIDFSASADLGGIDSIEPLDISTIFGNGIDNALEASEKLPDEQRAVLVKAGKVQNFLSVIIENNCLETSNLPGRKTTKEDKFIHGFGIRNMKRAAVKYGGQCITSCNNGKFTLKILIPIS